MVIKTEVKTREEYCRFFCSNVTNYKSFSSGIYSRARGELYGSIDGNDIWIVKTKQIIANLPQRFFEGKIVESSGNIQIVGKFKFSTMTYASTIAAIVLFFIIFTSSFPSDAFYENPFSIGLTSMAAIVGFPLSILGLGLLTSRNAEKDVVQFLHGRVTDNASPVSNHI